MGIPFFPPESAAKRSEIEITESHTNRQGTTMKTETCWIKSLAAEAVKCEQHQMPWAHGARPQAMIARRKAAETSFHPARPRLPRPEFHFPNRPLSAPLPPGFPGGFYLGLANRNVAISFTLAGQSLTTVAIGSPQRADHTGLLTNCHQLSILNAIVH